MKLKYDTLGNYIRLVDYRNRDLISTNVQGISIDKEFIPSVANVIGTDLSKYKLISKGIFACNPMHVGRDERLPIALYSNLTPAIVSPAYFMFEVIDSSILDEEYLMLWFRRPQFDRICWFKTDGSVRGGITWEDICRIDICVPPIEEQRRIVHCYQVVTERIHILQSLNSKYDEMMKAIYRHMFSNDYKISDSNASLDTLCLDIQRGYTPIYSSNSTIYDLNQKVNKGLYLDKQFFAMIDESANIPMEKYARKQDILINYLGDGTLGRVHYYNEITTNVVVNQFIIIIRTNPDLLLPEYLYSLLSSPEYQRIIQGSVSGSTGMLVLNISTIRDFKIPLPPLALQKVYVEKVDPIWECITTNYLEISNLEKLARCIISGI